MPGVIRSSVYAEITNVPEFQRGELFTIPGVTARGRNGIMFGVDLIDVIPRVAPAARVSISDPVALARRRVADLDGEGAEAFDRAVAAAVARGDLRDRDLFAGLPVRKFLRPFQLRCSAWLTAWGGGQIRQKAGAGKTFQTTAAGLAIPTEGAVVLVCKGMARYQWASGEGLRRLTDLPIYVVEPNAPQPLGRWLSSLGPENGGDTGIKWPRGKRPIVVVLWSSLVPWLESLKVIRPGVVLFDETHEGKAARREKWVVGTDGKLTARPLQNTAWAAATLTRAVGYSIGATATRVFDRLTDGWGQSDLIQPSMWGRTARKYLIRYQGGRPAQDHRGLDLGGPTHSDELQARWAAVSHYTPRSVTHEGVGTKIRIPVYIPEHDLSRIPPADVVKRWAKSGKNAREVDLTIAAWRKTPWVAEFLAEKLDEGMGIIVYTIRTDTADRLEEWVLRKWKDARPGENLWVLHGGRSDAREWERVRNLVQGRPTLGIAPRDPPYLIIATVDAIGQSTNWHEVDAVGWLEHPYSPGEVNQGEDRIHRIGREKIAFVWYFLGEGTYDDHVGPAILAPKQAHVAAEDAAGGEEADDAGELAAIYSGAGGTVEECETRETASAASVWEKVAAARETGISGGIFGEEDGAG